MKFAIVLAAFVAMVAADLADVQKYIDLNIDEVVKDPAQIKGYLVCFADIKACTESTTLFRDDFFEIIGTACNRCAPIQKYVTKKFLIAAKQFHPEMTAAISKKADPENKFFPALHAVIDNVQYP